ncbi:MULTISPECIES: DUF5687 family protein [Mesonia]|uniref:Uncharacterized protein n=1 Tax=Mesonia oceanica TaxID=2687242 RepID=A0AC61YE17_9FLAO|nr:MULTISPECIES: DUF5687 family protein [Mesonia]MAN27030.1 hypothetical protein [Mesonia sp.]VVV01940.1 hypothetical protein FVB9532_03235 [Mesonia oceanica]|tara:strand:+ start:5044 stop:6519 length:1476 start_codon:yes stop_codon:yes gene_type:complete
MFKRFIALEWKQFSRSSYFQKGIAIKILLAFGALYFIGMAAFMGVAAYFGLQKFMPDKDPITIVNNFVIYWFLADMVFRYFLQQLPVLNIKPYMVIPIKRSVVIHFLLGKTSISFFNFLPLFFFLPFSITLLVNGDYSILHIASWFFSMMLFTLSINYLNFLLNKNNKVFYVIASLLIAAGLLQFYGIYSVTEPAGYFFNTIYNKPYAVLIPLLLMVMLYRVNFKFIRKDFYLDGAISKETKDVHTQELTWLNRFGKIAPFLKNDVRMIMRNKRPKQVLLMSFLFLFYGLIFYTQETYQEMPAFLAFASMFVTGGFLMSFGQLVPSWDSEYYKLLMSQNIPYREYLKSKWSLMVVAVLISFILSTPYIYFGWDIFGMIAAGALFNMGLNSFITLYGGVLNRVPVELNVRAKAFSNTQGFNPTQLLIALPKIFGPILIFYIPYKLINFETGIICLAVSGVLGLVFTNFFLNQIEKVYQKQKYKTIAAFSEKK